MGLNGDENTQFARLLTEQFRQHSRLFFRLAYGIVRETGLAEDVCQQALTKAWECRDRIGNAARLRAWLARTVVNEALRLVRRKRTERRVLGEIGMVRDKVAWTEENRVELRESLMQALAGLADPVRTIVTLRLIRQMSGNDVAQFLGCSAVEVSRHLHAGLSQMRSVLEPFQAGVEP